MSYQKPRILHDYKDLFWSLIPLLLICVVFAGIASRCTFAAKGPAPGRIPHVDVDAALAQDARTLPFPIRNPNLPEDWTSNSGHRATVTGKGGGPVSTVGYITPQGAYMQLTQSNASEEALAGQVTGTRYATGAEQVGDRTWVVYAEPGSEPAWITDFGPVRVLITGAGNPAAFGTLAAATGAAQPLRP